MKAGRHVTAGRISCQLSVARFLPFISRDITVRIEFLIFFDNSFRAFGDFSFKSKAGLQAHEQAVCAVPDVKGKIPAEPYLSIAIF